MQNRNPYLGYMLITTVCMFIALFCGTSNAQLIGDREGDILNIESSGNMPVSIQDQHTQIVDVYMHRHLGGTLTIDEDTVIDEYTITISSTLAPVVGNLICLKESGRFFQAEILSFTGTNPYVLTLDSQLDYAFTTGGGCSLTSKHLNVDGSSTPVEFHVRPPVGTKWDITRMMFHIEDDAAMDDGLFGGITALTRGIVVRHRNGITHNIFNVKTNGDFALRAYDREYVTKPPAGTGHSMNVRRTFAGPSKNGVTIRLTDEDDYIVTVQDNLITLSVFYAIIQGHVVDEN